MVMTWIDRNRRERTGRKCRCEAGLDQQALSVQVEAERGRGMVPGAREDYRVVYCWQTSGNSYVDREPLLVGAVCGQSCRHALHCGLRIEDVMARREGTSVRARGVRV